MQRKVYVPGVALLAALAAGCTGGSGTDGSTADSKAGETSTAAAAPGKYRTLREPCGAVDRGTLRDLLPGAATLPEEQREKVYAGTAAVTYDTDRRVACRWKADSPDATHHLLVDFERVVSYDTAVSDDDRAKEVYARQEAAADLPSPTVSEEGEEGSSPSTSTSPSTSASKPAKKDDAKGNENGDAKTEEGESGSPSSSPATPEGLEPRTLAGLGDSAFLNDVLVRSGSTAQSRTVSVVFRTSNVIVTVQYSAHPALTTDVPDSKELQEKTQAVARNLAEQFSD
ncbi:DUF3558 domain-containing protein [Streptomyces spiramyceticus]|uniref:DUF3558 domain-containing protein n=1 Tax=Streptomyces spiramyceticus TaxID=299717 RepID=UPI00237AC7DD|nr:DUF3558 domain-containing protein [Streptomyces spiramyceticus]